MGFGNNGVSSCSSDSCVNPQTNVKEDSCEGRDKFSQYDDSLPSTSNLQSRCKKGKHREAENRQLHPQELYRDLDVPRSSGMDESQLGESATSGDRPPTSISAKSVQPHSSSLVNKIQGASSTHLDRCSLIDVANDYTKNNYTFNFTLLDPGTRTTFANLLRPHVSSHIA